MAVSALRSDPSRILEEQKEKNSLESAITLLAKAHLVYLPSTPSLGSLFSTISSLVTSYSKATNKPILDLFKVITSPQKNQKVEEKRKTQKKEDQRDLDQEYLDYVHNLEETFKAFPKLLLYPYL